MPLVHGSEGRLIYLRVWDLKCISAALCFVFSNVLFIVHQLQENANSSSQSNDANYNVNKASSSVKPVNYREYWKDLDPAYIERQWSDRNMSKYFLMVASFFGAMAWFFLMVPICQSAWVLSRGGKRSVGTHMLLAGLAVSGSIIELIARLLEVGMTNASIWMANSFNLDNWTSDGDGIGWRVLEMIHIATRGMLLWVDAFEALTLFGIVVVIFYSVASEPKFKARKSSITAFENEDSTDAASGGLVSTEVDEGAPPSSSPPSMAFTSVTTNVPVEPTFSKCFVWYGLFVGLLAIVDFLADVLRFVNWRIFGRVAIATNTLLGVFFLPVWILCLAQQLAAATEHFEREEMRVTALLGDRKDEIASLKADGREIS